LQQKIFWSLFTVLFFDFFFAPKTILVTFYCSFFRFIFLHQKKFWSLFTVLFFDFFFAPKNILVTFYCSFFRFFFVAPKAILVTFYCSFFRFFFFGPLSKNGLRNGLGCLVKALEHFFRNLAPNRLSF